MSAAPKPPGATEPPIEAPITPSTERWRAMSAAERDRFFERVYAAANASYQAMSEGQPHRRAKSATLQALVLHFKTSGRQIYVAEELPVLYPGEPSFTPDLMAVLDTPQPHPDKDQRMAWVVAEEGKGPDFLLEVLHKGSRAKDLGTNVTSYARLGIREYFVYDLQQQRIHGFRSPRKGGSYDTLSPRLGGRLSSDVLGLDLGVVEQHLRLFSGVSELANYEDYFDRISTIMAGIEARAVRAQAEAERAENALRSSMLTLAEAYGLEVSAAQREALADADLTALEALQRSLKTRRAWSL